MHNVSLTHTTYTRTVCRGIFGQQCEHILTARIVRINNQRYTMMKTNGFCTQDEHGYKHTGIYRVANPTTEPTTPLDYECEQFELKVDGVVVDSHDPFKPEPKPESEPEPELEPGQN